MSYHFKFIMPLINETITKDDLTENAGFVDAYSNFTQKPLLYNQIFVLYKAYSTTKSYEQRINKFRNLTNLYEAFNININGESHTLYILTITNNTIFRIMNGMFALIPKEKKRIMDFWKCEDSDINEYMCDSKTLRNHKYKTTYLNI